MKFVTFAYVITYLPAESKLNPWYSSAEDWSAMRLRAVGKIKSMTRNKAICLSDAGKRKVATTKKGRTAMKSVRKTAMKKS